MTPLVWLGCTFGVIVAGFFGGIVVPQRAARATAFAGITLGGLAAVITAIAILIQRLDVHWSGGVETHLAVRVDSLTATFVLIIGGVAVAVGLFALGGRTGDERGGGRSAACAACLVLLASLLVCVANDALFFIFGWELLALSFFYAIGYTGTDPRGPSAAYLTVLLTHAAGAGLLAAFVLLAHGVDFDLERLLAHAGSVDETIRGVAFVLMLVAFGAKVGLLPFSVWLARGYTTAPAVLAALMAGGALNVGFYGLARIGLGIGGLVPLWWAVLTLTAGALATFFGIAWASAQRDARTLAAYSSVENAGIIVIGLGVALAGRALGLQLMVGIGIAAALVHATAHAFAKCALFLGCSELVSRVGTTSFELLGGLARRLPVVTISVLVAATSLAALPPTGGFAGEWMTLEALLQAFRTASMLSTVTFALCGATIGVAAGIAVVAFVKLVGAALLGAPRSEPARTATASGSPLRGAGIVLAAAVALGVGLLAPSYLRLLAPAIDGAAGAAATAAILAESPLIQPAFHGFSSTWPLGLGALIAAFAVSFAILVALVRRPRTKRVPVWTSGGEYYPWTQYTGTGFANATRVILEAAVRVRRDITTAQPSAGAAPRITYESEARGLFGTPFWDAVGAFFLRIADIVRATQSGVIAAYLSYILAFVIILLIGFPSIRRW